MNCPFCGSKEITIPTPFVDRVTGEPETTYCCAKQAANQKYMNSRKFDPSIYKPSREDIEKL